MKKKEIILMLLVLGVLLSSTFASAGILEWLGLKKTTAAVAMVEIMQSQVELGRFATFGSFLNSYKENTGIWKSDSNINQLDPCRKVSRNSDACKQNLIAYCKTKWPSTADVKEVLPITSVYKPFYSTSLRRDSLGPGQHEYACLGTLPPPETQTPVNIIAPHPGNYTTNLTVPIPINTILTKAQKLEILDMLNNCHVTSIEYVDVNDNGRTCDQLCDNSVCIGGSFEEYKLAGDQRTTLHAGHINCGYGFNKPNFGGQLAYTCICC